MTTCTPRAAWINLLRRLHFAVGLFVGPFIFVAALTGTLYVATPKLESWIYREALTAQQSADSHSLAEQISVAEQAVGEHLPLFAVRPSLTPGETTRVMFSDNSLGESESRAIFIDPATLAVKGGMTVYGTSGILPLRQWIDYAHRSLLLGDIGRLYSELAASWMWFAACGGIALWFFTRPKRRINNRVQNTRRLHVSLGWLLLVGMLLFSVTGLTWSQWAGGNVDKLRATFGWLTPQVNTQLSGQAMMQDPHAEHHSGMTMTMPMAMPLDLAQFDDVLHLARQSGIDARKLEIRPPKSADKAWTVTEIDRGWPTQVDAVAIDADKMQVVDRTRFADFPLMAKLTRWGVDFHMGLLFGVINQIVLIAFGLSLCVMIVMGYRLWWIRRPSPSKYNPLMTLTQSWCDLSATGRCVAGVIALLLAFSMPVLGVSLVLFIAIDVLRWRMASTVCEVESPE
ncbi:MAG: PepSY-associated TM helix domain-containing protein [Scandinavium sp.]|uniref:PepSY-associated TM helix domain-containing protein n=1 Tax=Scandinavium sp. TaxID=2830653 RepID=UPI003F3E7783